MNVLIKTQFTNTKGTAIIALLKDETLTTALENIAIAFNVSSERLKGDFKGDFKEIISFYVGELKVYLLGLGEKPSSNDTINAFRNLSFAQLHCWPPKGLD